MAEGNLNINSMNARLVSAPEMPVSETVQITINPFQTDTEDSEPAAKKQRVILEQDSPQQSVKNVLFSVNNAICLRLDGIEKKLETILTKTKMLEEKMEILGTQVVNLSNFQGMGSPTQAIVNTINTNNVATSLQLGEPNLTIRKANGIVVGVPQKREISPVSAAVSVPTALDGTGHEKYTVITQGTSEPPVVQKIYSEGTTQQGMSQNITLITLNSEADHPNGTWLGDENNPEMRVRVPITPSDLIHIHSNCRTAEKMALTLLDYLFDRETQATSNLSGMGKHGKKQLDPLLIYGVRCHLIHRFHINEQDWHRIKQNIDSKCRTAFRRKQRGLPLTVKAFRGKAPSVLGSMLAGYPQLQMQDLSSHSDDSLQHEEGEIQLSQVDQIDSSHDGVVMAPLTQLTTAGAGGDIQVLHATPEQVAQLQQTHQIQILQGDQIIGHLGGNTLGNDIQVTVSLPNADTGGLSMAGGHQHSPLMCQVEGDEDVMHHVIKTGDDDVMHVIKGEPDDTED